MTKFIAHRINTLAQLSYIEPQYGVELDLRESNGIIHIEHEPFCVGESFDEYLAKYEHGTLILNVKCDGIELKILELINQYSINDYFFLDSAFPTIKNLSDNGERNIAIRFSEFEGMDTLRAMAGRVNWVWVDCFTSFPLTKEIYDEMKLLGYKVCIVSPELQQQEAKIESYGDIMKNELIYPDAICSKIHNIKRWTHILNLKN